MGTLCYAKKPQDGLDNIRHDTELQDQAEHAVPQSYMISGSQSTSAPRQGQMLGSDAG